MSNRGHRITQSTFINTAPAMGSSLPTGNGDGYKDFGTLYKHCNSSFLPKEDRDIRVGTLSAYRADENQAIRDAGEGVFKIVINFPEWTEVESGQLMQASMGTASFFHGINRLNLRVSPFYSDLNAGSVFSTDDLELDVISPSVARMKGSLNIFAESADAHIFSLSKSSAAGSVIMDEGYDSAWAMSAENILKFSNHLSAYLLQYYLRGTCFGKDTIGPLRMAGFPLPEEWRRMEMVCYGEIRETLTLSRKIEVTEKIGPDVINSVEQMVATSYYIKPDEFSGEKEVRLIFRPCMQDKENGVRYFIPFYLKPVFVPFGPILDVCEVVAGGGT